MDDPTPKHLLLKCQMRTREGKLAWGIIRPSEWSRIIEADDEVGVFSTASGDSDFLNGYIYMIVGIKNNGIVTWVKLDKKFDKTTRGSMGNGPSYSFGCTITAEPRFFPITRPSTPQEAVEIVRDFERRCLKSFVQADPQAFKKVTFCLQVSDATGGSSVVWREFPRNAYKDEQLWREVVPPPGGILRVIYGRA
ncbi:hypothetical protein B0H34DRAFT_767259 [Crassisporium funariophilum]|nr:hypothetical protein B0H34DRAFT_767259 [Crassisporium funariophilum]